MKLTLPQEALDALPEPDRDGVIRVTAGLKLSPDDEVRLVEINDFPVDGTIEPDKEDPEEESAEPDVGKMAEELYGPRR